METTLKHCTLQNLTYGTILSNAELIAQFIHKKTRAKIKWFEQNRARIESLKFNTWQEKVLTLFYQFNLNIDTERFGKRVYQDSACMIYDWQTECPILNKCNEEGVDTLNVCNVLFHTQYQVLLSLIEPGLVFNRDYERIRPYYHSCREIIYFPRKYPARRMNVHERTIIPELDVLNKF
ncbi:hypothetical protein JW960_20150 [candidate division KSB1 bacterium]|nr:hypothetical protein [candidate division KSB1 bacterium]